MLIWFYLFSAHKNKFLATNSIFFCTKSEYAKILKNFQDSQHNEHNPKVKKTHTFSFTLISN